MEKGKIILTSKYVNLRDDVKSIVSEYWLEKWVSKDIVCNSLPSSFWSGYTSFIYSTPEHIKEIQKKITDELLEKYDEYSMKVTNFTSRIVDKWYFEKEYEDDEKILLELKLG